MPLNQVKLVEDLFTPAQKSQIITKLTAASHGVYRGRARVTQERKRLNL
jgi:phenylpyruvate tautomerase PptA (4-oxalocrotonate tautomerase family)